MESVYLRGTQTAFTLSFSRSYAPVIVQYFNFHSLGNKGYQERMATLLSGAGRLSSELNGSGYFRCISPGHEPSPQIEKQERMICLCHEINCPSYRTSQPPSATGLPVVVFTLSDTFAAQHPQVTISDLSDRVYHKGFSIPCRFHLPSHQREARRLADPWQIMRYRIGARMDEVLTFFGSWSDRT